MSEAFEAERPPFFLNAHFARLWAAQALSAFGNRITRTAIPIIAISTLGVGPGQAALLSALGYLPIALFGVLGAGFVERANKLTVMVAMDVLRFAIVMLVPAAFLLNGLSFWLLCVVTTLAGAASALFANADASILPRLLPAEQLVAGNSRIQGTESFAELTGPGVAGVLIDVLTAPIAMLVDAASFLWSALWLRSIPRAAGRPEPDAGKGTAVGLSRIASDAAVGWRAATAQPAVRAVAAGTALYYLSAGVLAGLYMVFALREVGLSASVVGVIISLGGVSALCGAIVARTLSRALGLGPAIAASFALGMVGWMMLVPAALAPDRAVVWLVAQQLLGDGAFMAFSILSVSLIQSAIPPDRLSRSMGAMQALNAFALMAGTLGSGLLAEHIGVAPTIMVGAAVGLAAGLPMLSPALMRAREPDPSNGQGGREEEG